MKIVEFPQLELLAIEILPLISYIFLVFLIIAIPHPYPHPYPYPYPDPHPWCYPYPRFSNAVKLMFCRK